MSVKYPLKRSFSFALEGLRTCIKQEPNFRIHILLALVSILLAISFGFTQIEWIVLIIVISSVFTLEFINTSIEAVVDLLSLEKQEAAKKAKDVAAAGVLVSSISAVLIGAILFLPKIFLLF